jgi:hypothetical protein
MTQTKLSSNIASIGEEIGVELGTQMVKDYQQANPSDVHSFLIGRKIIDQILAQPGCVGIKFYSAYDEIGKKTFVYVGVDQNGKAIIECKVVNTEGQLDSAKGIVADRIGWPNGGGSKPRTSTFTEDDDFWAFD